jgi:heat-inducible transcriptional repressor
MTGKPVGSRSFVQKYSFNISPATMRNIMFDLESCEFLMQPHTSAGRVPTDKGYRYYVDSLLDTYEFDVEEQFGIREDIFLREVQLEKMFNSVAKMLSLVSKYAGIVLTPRPDFTVVKHIELLSLDSNDILMIVITRTGIVLNKKVKISESLTQEDLRRYSRYLTSELRGYSLYDIKKRLFDSLREALQSRIDLQIALDIAQLGLSESSEADLYIEGIENILHIPEMIQESHLRSFLYLVEDKKNLAEIMNDKIGHEGVLTLIGNEINDVNVTGCSIVTSSYKIGNKNVGMLGILGPTRMNYQKVVPLIDYTSKIVSRLLTQMSG